MSEDETKVVVLVADDEPSTLALVASHVRSKGYEVLEAYDGDQAWQLAHEHLPDLVILDVMMPGMSGWEVCRKIREAVSLAHTGVIMLTGIGENLNEMTSPLYGADTYLDKPFEFTELDQRIDDTLASRKDGAMGRPDTSDPQSSTPRPGNGMAAQPSLAKATLRSEPPPPYDEDDDDDDDDDDDVSDDEEASSDDAAPAPSQDEDDDEEPATMPKPKLKSLAPKKAPKGMIAKAASGVGAFLEKAAKILAQPKGKAPKKAAPAKAAKKAAPAKTAKKAAPAKAAKKAAPKKAASKKAAPKKAATKKAAPKKAAPKKAASKKAAPKKAATKKAAKAVAKPAKAAKKPAKAVPAKAAKKAPAARPEAKKAASKPRPAAKASGARPTRPSPSGGDVTV